MVTDGLSKTERAGNIFEAAVVTDAAAVAVVVPVGNGLESRLIRPGEATAVGPRSPAVKLFIVLSASF